MSHPRVAIAYVTTRFPVRSETAVIKEIHELEEMGFHVTVFSLKPSSYDEPHDPKADRLRGRTLDISPGLVLRALAGHVAALATRPAVWLGLLGRTLARGGRHLPKLAWLFLVSPGVAAEVRRRGCRYVHANFGSYQAYVAWIVHRLTGLPYGFTVHAQDIFLNRFLMLEKARDAAILASISEYNIRFLREKDGVAGPQVRLVRCGVDLDELPFLPRGTVGTPLRIFSVGRFNEKKGLVHLVRACALLREGIDFQAEIVGEGEEEPRIRAAIAEGRLEGRVRLRSGLSHRELLDAYRRADVMVLPCQVARDGDLDGIPATLMEAMALGVPVITTAVSGIPELVQDGRTGLLVPPEDAVAIARAVERLVDEPDLVVRLAREGRRRIEEDYDIRKNSRAMGELIRAVLAGGAPAGGGAS